MKIVRVILSVVFFIIFAACSYGFVRNWQTMKQSEADAASAARVEAFFASHAKEVTVKGNFAIAEVDGMLRHDIALFGGYENMATEARNARKMAGYHAEKAGTWLIPCAAGAAVFFIGFLATLFPSPRIQAS